MYLLLQCFKVYSVTTKCVCVNVMFHKHIHIISTSVSFNVMIHMRDATRGLLTVQCPLFSSVLELGS